MKKKLLYMALSVMFINLYAQVGIKTPTPQNTLHVNGSLQVVKDLNVGVMHNQKDIQAIRANF